MASWEILNDWAQQAIVTAVRLGHGGSCTADAARAALLWAVDVIADGPAGDRVQREQLAAVLRGEAVIGDVRDGVIGTRPARATEAAA